MFFEEWRELDQVFCFGSWGGGAAQGRRVFGIQSVITEGTGGGVLPMNNAEEMLGEDEVAVDIKWKYFREFGTCYSVQQLTSVKYRKPLDSF